MDLFPFPLITARISDSLEVHRTCPQCLTILYMTPQECVVTDLNLETLFHSQLHSGSTGIAQKLLPPSRQAPFFESKNLYSFCRSNNSNYIRLGSQASFLYFFYFIINQAMKARRIPKDELEI